MAKVHTITPAKKNAVAKKARAGSAVSRVRKKKLANSNAIQRVLPLGNAWVVKADRDKEFTVITTLQSEAIKVASALAKHEHAVLVIHNKNGTIKSQKSFAGTIKAKRAS